MGSWLRAWTAALLRIGLLALQRNLACRIDGYASGPTAAGPTAVIMERS